MEHLRWRNSPVISHQQKPLWILGDKRENHNRIIAYHIKELW